ncbi:Periplasmic heavy metal sensor [Azospirillaceae bacterium]
MKLRTPFLRRCVLPTSLALNVFLISVVGVHLWRGPPHHNFAQDIARLAERLPEADGRILRDNFATIAPRLEEAHVLMRSFPERVRDAVRREPLNVAHLQTVLQEGMAARDRFETMLGKALVDTVSAMSPEARRNLAEWRGPPGPPPEPPPR